MSASQSAEQKTPTLSISQVAAPSALKLGANYGLRGVIQTDCGKITSVMGWVLDENGKTIWKKEYQPNEKTHNLRYSLNNDFKFGQLAEGTYTYKVEATAVNGDKKATMTLVEQGFTVGSGKTNSPAATAATYTVSYYANGGTGTMSDTEMTVGKSSQLRANSFTRNGYVFSGWALTPDGAVRYTDKQEVSLSDNGGVCVDLYAHWEPASSMQDAAEGAANGPTQSEISQDSEGALKMVAVAKEKEGKKADDLGFKTNWCSYFVALCGKEAAPGLFPASYKSAHCATPKDLGVWMANHETGYLYYFYQDLTEDSLKKNNTSEDPSLDKTYYIPVDKESFSPQKGDLILFRDKIDSFNWQHIGIVLSSDQSSVEYISGNTKGISNGPYWKTSCVATESINKTDGKITGYIRPRYSEETALVPVTPVPAASTPVTPTPVTPTPAAPAPATPAPAPRTPAGISVSPSSVVIDRAVSSSQQVSLRATGDLPANWYWNLAAGGPFTCDWNDNNSFTINATGLGAADLEVWLCDSTDDSIVVRETIRVTVVDNTPQAAVVPEPQTTNEPALNSLGYNMKVNVGKGSTLRFCSTVSVADKYEIGSIPNGATVYVYGTTKQQYEDRTWAKINYNGVDGWVNYKWLAEEGPEPQTTNEPELNSLGYNMKVNVGKGSTLRFCSTVSVADKYEIGSIPNGAMVYVYGTTKQQYEDRTWAKINYNGVDGWVNYKWLS